MDGLTSALYLFVVIVSNLVDAKSDIGDSCILTTGVNGTCKLLSQCEPAKRLLLQNQQFPKTCGFERNEPIVCCLPGDIVQDEDERLPGDISKKKCKEYAQYAQTQSSSASLLPGEPKLQIIPNCDTRRDTLIPNGGKAAKNEFPHMAFIGYQSDPDAEVQWLCGATLISDEYILTAAHCMFSPSEGDAKWVRIGVRNFDEDIKNNLNQDIKIAERIAYPEYNPRSYYHDIGLFRLEAKAKLSPSVRPACLNVKRDISVQKVIVTEWDAAVVELRKSILSLVTQEVCNSSYQNQIGRRLRNGIVEELQICAGSDHADKDNCQIDAGGALQIYHLGDDIQCMYDLIGVSSFGRPCSKSPDVFARVSNYIKWIEDIVWPDK